ncbi:DUF2637 domain-containing protein [Streptomyces nigrescens]|uniref:DUF2637 domain-containing protein n=1 Tax=Streptomyces nigrescens TaxID=1920 RepID=UPI0036FB2A15
MIQPSPGTSSVGHWDRAAILLLGAAGCALSYDALQQMAIAIHVRSWLTYLYPVVIDGFIAYGVRALILSRTAPLRARLYVWALFGTATAASIWANSLHAIRLNQATTASGAGLRLGDVTVGVLSTLAPLALAGAVHLYILISRHIGPEADHQQPEATHGPTLRQRLLRGRRGRTGGPTQPSVPSLRTADRSAEPVPTLSGPQSKAGPQGGLANGLVRAAPSATDERRTNAAAPADGPQTKTTDGPVRTPPSATNNQRTNPAAPADGPQTKTTDGPVRTPPSATNNQRTNAAAPADGPQTKTGPHTGTRAPRLMGPQSTPDCPTTPTAGPADASGGRRTEQSADQGLTDASRLMPTRTGPLARTAHADRSATAQGNAVDRAATSADRQTDSSSRVRTGPHGADHPSRTNDQQRTATADRSATPRTAQADRKTDGAVRARSASRGPVRTRTSSPGTDTDDISALVPIARRAIEREGRINRTVVRNGLRAHDIQVSNERLGFLLQHLRSGR